MKSMLLAAGAALAAMVLSASPGEARQIGGSGETSGRVFNQPRFACQDLVRDGRSIRIDGLLDGRDRRRMRAICNSDTIMDVYGGEWALYNNRTWEPDSYNDWWHDRPDRAYPAWMRHNQDCQRMWFAGDTLRC
jgi:hypothetical protein